MRVDVLGTRGFPGIQGGVERHCERLYPCMEGADLRVFRRRPYVNPDYRGASYPRIRFTDLPSTRIRGVEAVVHSFLSTVVAAFSSARIVHIHNIGPALFSPLLKLCGKKVVLTYHSANYEHDKWGRMAKTLLRLSEKIGLSCADRVIFVSKFQMMKYSAEVRAKSDYIPNGIVPMKRSVSTSFLDSLSLAPCGYFLSVGRITPEKGFDLLIQAYRRLRTGKKLVIAGSPDQDAKYFDELKRMADGDDRIVFAGFVDGDNLSQLYTNAAAYVLPSRTEGFPLVLLEAINFGLPLLVSDIPATHLLDLPAVSYFRMADSEALADKLGEFLSVDDAERYKGVSVCLSDYDWHGIAASVERIYGSLCTAESVSGAHKK